MGKLLSNVQYLEYVCSEISFVMKGVWRFKILSIDLSFNCTTLKELAV